MSEIGPHASSRLEGPLISAESFGALEGPLVVLDARVESRGRRAYEESHLSGALWVDLETDLAAPSDDPSVGGRHPLPPVETWCRRLGEWGIGPETAVVVYDDQGGALAAARVWWMLRAVDHPRVALLDGGWQAAVEAGLRCDSDTQKGAGGPVYPSPVGGTWSRPTVDIAAVDELRLDHDRTLIDVRAPDRYSGANESLDPVAGHIPGAINLPYEDNLDSQGRFLPSEALRQRYERHAGREVTVYCGSGVTACHALFALELAGLDDGSLFVGSWSEWCRSARPRALVFSD